MLRVIASLSDKGLIRRLSENRLDVSWQSYSKCSLIFVCLCYRQLEAIIRISESQAKMRLAPFAMEADVDEALRLFQVSTLDAAMSGNLAGKEKSLFYNINQKGLATLEIATYCSILKA